MAQKALTFRVFISSTFSDLKEERNALQQKVFPKLRKKAAEEGCSFQAIDLRWGVSEEASVDQQTMNICLSEVKRCQRVTPQPNFLVLMGDRYGWMPPPPQITASEFERIKKVLTEVEIKKLVWEETRQASGDNGWYRLDNNVEEGVYKLQPWRGFSMAEWGDIEKDLHKILLKGAQKAKIEDVDFFKYWSSATHQEIDVGALKVKNASDHLFCFFREIDKSPPDFSAKDFIAEIDERIKMEYPDGFPEPTYEGYLKEIKKLDETSCADDFNKRIKSLQDSAEKNTLERQFLDQVKGWLIDFTGSDFWNLNDDWTIDQDAYEKQKELKKELEAQIPNSNIKNYKAEWSGRGITTSGINQLCEDVYESLYRSMMKEIKKNEESKDIVVEEKDALIKSHEKLDEEGIAHRIFAEKLLKYFIGRIEIREKIAKYLSNSEPSIFAIYGKGGCGKSALAAKVIQETQASFSGSQLVYRFIGATPSSSAGRFLLESLCQEISRRYEAPTGEIPSDYKDLVPELEKRLSLATADSPLILLLDSLDQLSPHQSVRRLNWLPNSLPENVHIIVTTRQEEDTFDNLKNKQAIFEELGGLSRKEGDELLSEWLSGVDRTLQVSQRTEVLDKFMNEESDGAPLYLKLAFEEARLWPSWDEKSAMELKPGIEGIIEHNLFNRLDNEDSHGEMLVSKVLGYLAASRYGLAEDEMIDLLSRDIEMYEWFFKKSYHLPSDIVQWAIRRLREKDEKPIKVDEKSDAEDERAAVAWLRDLRPPPEEVSKDLMDFLKKVLPESEGPKLPIVLWSRLSLDLEPYMNERVSEGSILMTFYHRELRDVSEKIYLNREKEIHERIADYFFSTVDPIDKKVDPEGEREWKGNNPRGLSELPYHLSNAEMWDEMFKTMTDFVFLERKAAEVGVVENVDGEGVLVKTYTGSFDLQKDYDEALAAIQKGGGAGSDDDYQLIATAIDSGKGLAVYCPMCDKTSAIEKDDLDSVITCPTEKCGTKLKINPFVIKR